MGVVQPASVVNTKDNSTSFMQTPITPYSVIIRIVPAVI